MLWDYVSLGGYLHPMNIKFRKKGGFRMLTNIGDVAIMRNDCTFDCDNSCSPCSSGQFIAKDASNMQSLWAPPKS